ILGAYQILFAFPLAYFTYISIKNNRYRLPTSAWFLLAFALVAGMSVLLNIDSIPRPSKNFGKIKYFLFGAFGILVLKSWLLEASINAKRIVANIFLLSITVA